jgi:hypothetical protein
MSADWLYDVDIRILAIGSIVAFLACAAAGQWIGARFRSEESESALSVITSTQAATLGMFAILISFSFSIAMSLFEQRRALLLDEANAIGTTELRAGMLPQPFAGEANRLLRDMSASGCRSTATRMTRRSSLKPSRPRPSCTTSFGGRRARRARCSRSRCRSASMCSRSTS